MRAFQRITQIAGTVLFFLFLFFSFLDVLEIPSAAIVTFVGLSFLFILFNIVEFLRYAIFYKKGKWYRLILALIQIISIVLIVSRVINPEISNVIFGVALFSFSTSIFCLNLKYFDVFNSKILNLNFIAFIIYTMIVLVGVVSGRHKIRIHSKKNKNTVATVIDINSIFDLQDNKVYFYNLS